MQALQEDKYDTEAHQTAIAEITTHQQSALPDTSSEVNSVSFIWDTMSSSHQRYGILSQLLGISGDTLPGVDLEGQPLDGTGQSAIEKQVRTYMATLGSRDTTYMEHPGHCQEPSMMVWTKFGLNK